MQLAGTAAASILELLKLFAYGTWSDYEASATLKAQQPLSEAQQTKLKKLTVVSLASQSKTIAYDTLLRELQMRSVREVEDLLIECIYGGLLQGRLDQAARQLEVFSCTARDVDPKELDAMSDTLRQVTQAARVRRRSAPDPDPRLTLTCSPLPARGGSGTVAPST